MLMPLNRLLRKRTLRGIRAELRGAGWGASTPRDVDKLSKLVNSARDNARRLGETNDENSWRAVTIEAASAALSLLKHAEGLSPEVALPSGVFSQLKGILDAYYVPSSLKSIAEPIRHGRADGELVYVNISQQEAENLLEEISKAGGISEFLIFPPPLLLPRPKGPGLAETPWCKIIEPRPGEGHTGPCLCDPGTEAMIVRSPRQFEGGRLPRILYLVGIRPAVTFLASRIYKQASSGTYVKRSHIDVFTNCEVRVFKSFRAARKTFAALCQEATRRNASGS